MQNLPHTLSTASDSVNFADTIAVIDAHYDFTPTAFRNGELDNAAGQNNGSCKVFPFAKLRQLTSSQTLHYFGSHYRDDALQHPEAADSRPA